MKLSSLIINGIGLVYKILMKFILLIYNLFSASKNVGLKLLVTTDLYNI